MKFGAVIGIDSPDYSELQEGITKKEAIDHEKDYCAIIARTVCGGTCRMPCSAGTVQETDGTRTPEETLTFSHMNSGWQHWVYGE
jgi:hypothetical protein